MSYKLIKKLANGVRIGELMTAHGKIETPFFMPVGTVGSVKATAPWELEEMGAQIVLSNTYHLYLRPGEQLIKELGGLHSFMHWDKPILTDSGGYQVFSLAKNSSRFTVDSTQLGSEDGARYINVISSPVFEYGVNSAETRLPARQGSHDKKILHQAQDDTLCQISPTLTGGRNDQHNLVKITDDGVEFRSHLDGSSHFFTPEKVIDIQLALGVDILMPLDVCPSGKADRKEVERSVELTIAWARRSKLHFDRRVNSEQCTVNSHNEPAVNRKLSTVSSAAKRPLLHGIVQGGLYEDLRRKCAAELIKLDFDGYSIGGLAVDFETRDMWKIVKLMGEILPENKQRYLMGVGTPDDIIKATKLGMDMFDCVLPTRLARHGNVYINCHSRLDLESKNSYELVNLLNNKYRTDRGVIDENCSCLACQEGKGFSCAYISHLIRSKEILGIRLTTLHNLTQYLELMRDIREDLV